MPEKLSKTFEGLRKKISDVLSRNDSRMIKSPFRSAMDFFEKQVIKAGLSHEQGIEEILRYLKQPFEDKEVYEAFKNALLILEKRNPQAAEKLVKILFTSPNEKEKYIKLYMSLPLAYRIYDLVEVSTPVARRLITPEYLMSLANGVTKADSNIKDEDIERTLNERKAEIERFHKGEMSERERLLFLRELAQNRTLRLATIHHAREIPDYSESLNEETRNQFETLSYSMLNFILYSPGSFYVAGIEFRADIIHSRNIYISEAKDVALELLRKGCAPEFVLENLWRVSFNKLVVDTIPQWNYPQNEFLGLINWYQKNSQENSQESSYQLPPNFLRGVTPYN